MNKEEYKLCKTISDLIEVVEEAKEVINTYKDALDSVNSEEDIDGKLNQYSYYCNARARAVDWMSEYE